MRIVLRGDAAENDTIFFAKYSIAYFSANCKWYRNEQSASCFGCALILFCIRLEKLGVREGGMPPDMAETLARGAEIGAEFPRGHAHDRLKRFCEFAAVIISEIAGDIENGTAALM